MIRSSSPMSFFVIFTRRRLLNTVPNGIPSPIFPRCGICPSAFSCSHPPSRGQSEKSKRSTFPIFSGRFQCEPLLAHRNVDLCLRAFLHLRLAVGCAVPKVKSYHIAVVGATGAVGAELLGVFERRGFPVERLLHCLPAVRPERLFLFEIMKLLRRSFPRLF